MSGHFRGCAHVPGIRPPSPGRRIARPRSGCGPEPLARRSKHRHFVKLATGERVAVGPQICENANLRQAFNQFHYNIHSFVPGFGVVHTLGPQDGAPGLHNGAGAEVIAVPGCPS